jgi:hypothetical protein
MHSWRFLSAVLIQSSGFKAQRQFRRAQRYRASQHSVHVVQSRSLPRQIASASWQGDNANPFPDSTTQKSANASAVATARLVLLCRRTDLMALPPYCRPRSAARGAFALSKECAK